MRNEQKRLKNWGTFHLQAGRAGKDKLDRQLIKTQRVQQLNELGCKEINFLAGFIKFLSREGFCGFVKQGVKEGDGIYLSQ